MKRNFFHKIVGIMAILLLFGEVKAQQESIFYEDDISANSSPLDSSVTSIDRWGYPHIAKLPYNGGGMQTNSITCGNNNQFTLIFEDELVNSGAGNGIGFDDPTVVNSSIGSTLGEVRRNTACAVFSYISSVIDVGTANPVIFFPVSDIDGAGPLGTGTSFYSAIASSGFWGGWLNEYITTQVNPAPPNNEHAHIFIDFGARQIPAGSGNFVTINSDYTISSSATGEIDLFSVILHEATHSLGFASFIGQNGNSLVNGLYSTYDQYLKHSNFLLDPSAVFQGTSADLISNNVIYQKAGNTMDYAAYSPISFSTGSSLSHFDDIRDNAQYLMRPSTSGGDDREYTQPELEVLCNLGYTLINFPFDCTDHFPIAQPDATTGQGGVPICFSVLANDSDPDGQGLLIDPSSLVALNTTAALSINGSNQLCVTLAANFCGTAYIQYRPIDNVYNRPGNYTTLAITVNCASCPNDPCNYVCNGGFEGGLTGAGLDIFLQTNAWYNTMATCPVNASNGWCASVGTPDFFARGSTTLFGSNPAVGIPINFHCNSLTGMPSGLETYNGTPNDHYVNCSRQLGNMGNCFEGIYRDLIQPTSAGLYNFSIYCYSKDNPGRFNVYLNATAPNVNPNSCNSNFTSATPILVNQLVPDDGQWHLISLNNISLPSGMNFIIIEPNVPIGNNSSYHFMFFDDVRLEKAGNNLQVTKTVSDVTPQIGDIITYTISIHNAGANTSAATTVTDILPPGLSYVGAAPNFNVPAIVGNGNYIISYQVLVGANVALNTLIPNCASVANSACVGGGTSCVDIEIQTADIAVEKILNTPNPVSGTNADFTITISNNGPADAHNVHISEILPTCLSYISSTISAGATYNATTGLINIPLLAVGQSVTLNLTALYTAYNLCPTCQNCATLVSLDESDLNSANNLSCVDLSSNAPPIPNMITGPINSSSLWSWGQTVTGQFFEVSGELTIDSYVIFDNCEFNMQKGSKITIIRKGFYLQNNTHLYACEDMWWGIEIIAPNGYLKATNSTIEDAQWGVWINDKSSAYIDQCTFQQNFVGIFVPQHPLSYNSISATITNCIFDGYTPLQSANLFAGQSPTPLQRALAGIWVYDVALNLPNHIFRGLCNGIISGRGNLVVTRNSFTDIQPFSAYGNGYPVMKNTFLPSGATPTLNYNGTGIIQWGAHGLFTLKQSGFGSNTNDPLSFSNCKRGIAAFYTNLFSSANRMNAVEDAIFVNIPTSMQTYISNNRINCTHTGVVAQMTDFASSTTIETNTISVNCLTAPFLTSLGIKIDNFATAANTNINNNTVSLSRAYRGIYATNADKVAITRNKVYMDLYYSLDGIYLESTDNAVVMCDSVRGFSTTVNSNGIHLFSSVNNLISCNKTHNTWRGFYFRGDCTSDNNFRGNRIHNHNTGLQIGLSGTASKIGIQQHRGNQWQPQGGFSYTTSAWCVPPSLPASSYFYVHTAPGSVWHPTGINPSGWFQNFPGTPFNDCGGDNTITGDCAGGMTIVGEDITESDLNVAAGLSVDFPFGEEMRYQAESELYEKLDKNLNLVPETGSIYDFYTTKTGTSIQDFSEINQAHEGLLDADVANQLAQYDNEVANWLNEIALKDSVLSTTTDSLDLTILYTEKDSLHQLIKATLAVSHNLSQSAANMTETDANLITQENQSIVDSLLVESNEKAINEIFYSTIAQDNFEFSNNQIETITNIAFQCPLAGGEGVFKARALYHFIVGDTTYDDSTMCAAQGLNWRKGHTLTSHNPKNALNVYPNPANKTLNIHFTTKIPVSTPIILTNLVGVKMKEVFTQKEDTHFVMSMEDIPQGIYFLSSRIGDELVTTKIVVIH